MKDKTIFNLSILLGIILAVCVSIVVIGYIGFVSGFEQGLKIKIGSCR